MTAHQENAQNQHYVPKLLLRGFLSKDSRQAAKEQVHILDLETGKNFTSSILNIMGERRFNDVWIDQEYLVSIEPAAGRIESHVSPLIDKIRLEKRLCRSEDERTNLSLLLAFQFIRTKKIRLLPQRLNAHLRVKVKRMGYDPANADGLRDWDENGLKRAHAQAQVKDLLGYTKIMRQKELFLMQAGKGAAFNLGDHPVVLHNDEPRRGIFGNLGIGVPFIQIYLPLSSDLMLCAYDPAVLGQMLRGHDEELTSWQAELLQRVVRHEITADQMRQMLERTTAIDFRSAMIDAIRAGRPVPIDSEQVKFYNSLQAAQAHRFVIDPHGKFDVARMVMADRRANAGEFADN
jgi:hypothetical protein